MAARAIEVHLQNFYKKKTGRNKDLSFFNLLEWSINKRYFEEHELKLLQYFRQKRNDIMHNPAKKILESDALFFITKSSEVITKLM